MTSADLSACRVARSGDSSAASSRSSGSSSCVASARRSVSYRASVCTRPVILCATSRRSGSLNELADASRRRPTGEPRSRSTAGRIRVRGMPSSRLTGASTPLRPNRAWAISRQLNGGSCSSYGMTQWSVTCFWSLRRRARTEGPSRWGVKPFVATSRWTPATLSRACPRAVVLDPTAYSCSESGRGAVGPRGRWAAGGLMEIWPRRPRLTR